MSNSPTPEAHREALRVAFAAARADQAAARAPASLSPARESALVDAALAYGTRFDAAHGDAATPVAAPELVWPEDDEYEEDDEVDEGEDYEEAEVVPATPAQAAGPTVHVVPSWELTDDDLRFDREAAPKSSHVALPVFPSRDAVTPAYADEDDEDDEPVISLTSSGPPRVEELDLAAMVDVAFQLVLFFLVTNFGAWLGSAGFYPQTAAGLGAAYVAGIPFFQWTVLGTLAYAAILFGGFALLRRRVPALRAQTA